MMTIESQLDQVDWKTPDAVIAFYESNKLYFDNAGLVRDEEKVQEILKIQLHYADALYQKSKFDKALQTLKQINDLLERLGNQHWYYAPAERQSRFLRGMVLDKTGHFREARSLFEQLVKEDPENYYYRLWYNHTRLGLFNWISNGLLLFGTFVIFFDVVFSLNEVWPFDPGLYGFIIVGLTFVTQRVVRSYFKEKK